MLRTAGSVARRAHCVTESLQPFATYSTNAAQTSAAGSTAALPRYMRRAIQFNRLDKLIDSEKKRKSKSSQPDADNSPKVFRSKHWDPSKNTEDGKQKKHLDPYVLTNRLKKLCDKGKLDEAVNMLKNAPRDAQNTVVWNSLIWECMKAARYSLGYKLFTDMKRRGHSPSARTYRTMFAGLARIESWATHAKQLENARRLYDSFQKFIASVKKHNPTSKELTVDPLGSYIAILAAAGKYDEIWEVYNALDTDESMSLNAIVYTAMFRALAQRTPEQHAAGDAKLLWTQMLNRSPKNPHLVLDGPLLSSAVSALSKGRPTEQLLAYNILRQYFGLNRPDDPPSTDPSPHPLTPQALIAALMLANARKDHQTCLDFFEQVKRRPQRLGDEGIIDRGHVEQVLEAQAALATTSAIPLLNTLDWMVHTELSSGSQGVKLRPGLSTYNLILYTCWRVGDWNTATRVFAQMTGYHCHDFMDGAVKANPRREARPNGRNFDPSLETMSTMLRTAIASGSRANIRQCLRIVAYLDLDHLLGFLRKENASESRKALKSRAFFAVKLAEAVKEATQEVLNHAPKDEKESRVWTALQKLACHTIEHEHEYEQITPAATSLLPPAKERHLRALQKSVGSSAGTTPSPRRRPSNIMPFAA
ncbi:hypothetical protein FISHEDRAFT_72544 [Fistulina hepatica ATCC 64428]|nr:hypothetical protein FISHEDRAFT_72544 [Fistulina hepatica ATCC 64428]